MDEAPISEAQAKSLRFLRLLVTVLTATMIIGLLTIVALFVIRFSSDRVSITIPDEIPLPDGARATAFTRGSNWYAVVTDSDEILIFDGATNELRQTVKVNAD
ncbi:MAG: hypothetical protein COB40_03840 [Marinosulfonomonas sp.]|nr:MAG: hypothetical protein COB40_03840 [Marinosulfonomonas sp.]